jgi:hypothetical protein
MRFACLRTKATDTFSEYVILLAFPLQQWLQECAAILRYAYVVFFLGHSREERVLPSRRKKRREALRQSVVVCLVIGGRTGMSDMCLTSPKSETQCFTCQPFCCTKKVERWYVRHNLFTALNHRLHVSTYIQIIFRPSYTRESIKCYACWDPITLTEVKYLKYIKCLCWSNDMKC